MRNQNDFTQLFWYYFLYPNILTLNWSIHSHSPLPQFQQPNSRFVFGYLHSFRFTVPQLIFPHRLFSECEFLKFPYQIWSDCNAAFWCQFSKENKKLWICISNAYLWILISKHIRLILSRGPRICSVIQIDAFSDRKL